MRAEIVDLIAALDERRSGVTIVTDQTTKLLESLASESADEGEARNPYWGAQAIFAQQLSGVYGRIYRHAITIRMLTTDEAITGPTYRIGDAAHQEREVWEGVFGRRGQPGAIPLREEDKTKILELQAIMTEASWALGNYAREQWGTISN